MDPTQLEQHVSEYYGALNPLKKKELQDLLNAHGGIILAKVGNHPPWPARVRCINSPFQSQNLMVLDLKYSELGEFLKMIRYRQKRTQICVYFFGSRNYGWVFRNALQAFRETIPQNYKALKKHGLQQKYEEALEEAIGVLSLQDEVTKRFYDRLQEQKSRFLETTCEICNCTNEKSSLLILCDGENCNREYHMECLQPPLGEIPEGKWFCPNCKTGAKAHNSPRKYSSWTPLMLSEFSPAVGSSDNSGALKKSIKKDKMKPRDSLLKRKLPKTSLKCSVNENFPRTGSMEVRTLSKRPRTFASADDTENDSTDGKHTAEIKSRTNKWCDQISALETISPGRSVPPTHLQTELIREKRESDERCLICGLGGEVVICDAPECTKVYHQFCLGEFPFPRSEDATWFCPRHTCAVTHTSELEDSDTYLSSSIQPCDNVPIARVNGVSPRKTWTRKTLWKCIKCPLALSERALPPLLPAQIQSRKQRSFLCVFCGNDAPLRVQLAKLLERVWSNLATNRQGYPFCGPLLNGLDASDHKDCSPKAVRMDLFTILSKIRALKYETSSAFVRDIDRVVEDALELIDGRSMPLIESATSLKIVSTEHMMNLRHRIDLVERKHLPQQQKVKVNTATVWPIPWRKECKGDDILLRTIGSAMYVEARSLEEWTAFVCKASMYVTTSKPPKSNSQVHSASDGNRKMKDSISDEDTSALQHHGSDNQIGCSPGLTLEEGVNALTSLSQKQKPVKSEQLEFQTQDGNQMSEEVSDKDFFLSPSTTEMQHMFDQQSSVLRQALEGHAVLRKTWKQFGQEILSTNQHQRGLTIGEGRLAAELRLANRNLRARLRQKDHMIERLTNEHARLRAEFRQLSNELEASRRHSEELDHKSNGSDACGTG
ncbi:unnamed protein product [Albugo candida]|uniref:PHD-type domain-containing protein n=2 Tax=Albugo candida TaxID=65357 RepID=A0A024G2A4_9STRA|nr:unnamed protein product [Albugo candida]|eukprot:CCI40801.1 unnamed protein product [Albugo candida]